MEGQETHWDTVVEHSARRQDSGVVSDILSILSSRPLLLPMIALSQVLWPCHMVPQMAMNVSLSSSQEFCFFHIHISVVITIPFWVPFHSAMSSAAPPCPGWCCRELDLSLCDPQSIPFHSSVVTTCTYVRLCWTLGWKEGMVCMAPRSLQCRVCRKRSERKTSPISWGSTNTSPLWSLCSHPHILTCALDLQGFSLLITYSENILSHGQTHLTSATQPRRVNSFPVAWLLLTFACCHHTLKTWQERDYVCVPRWAQSQTEEWYWVTGIGNHLETWFIKNSWGQEEVAGGQLEQEKHSAIIWSSKLRWPWRHLFTDFAILW
jgi:hypothetical protein